MMTLHLGSCIMSTMQGIKLRQLSVGSMCSAETESVVHKLRQLSVGSMCSAEAESVVTHTSKEVPSGSWARLVSRGVRSGSLWVFFTKQRPRKDSFSVWGLYSLKKMSSSSRSMVCSALPSVASSRYSRTSLWLPCRPKPPDAGS